MELHTEEKNKSDIEKHDKKIVRDETNNQELLHENQIHKSCDESSSSNQHANLVAEHYNALPEIGLTYRNQSRIIHMRNFNNWIKSQFLNEYLRKIKESKNHQESIKVLDLCCGKGGDLLKWSKEVSHVICVDIAEKSVEQCQARYTSSNKTKFTAEFLTEDCSKVRLRGKYKDPTIKLDLVSCQFAFHYCFESLPQAECMFRNASETLAQGGYFIGTIPNANELVSRWKKCGGNKFGNDVYSVEFHCDKENIPLFGAKYNFHLEGVVDCPEFLVHKKTFEKLGLKFGLELVLFETFADYFEKMKASGKHFLTRMEALEEYPSRNELKGNIQDYQHAENYRKNMSQNNKIGTLSQSEWEAITIYSVFAFKKLKTSWNAEGKPEYSRD